MDPISNINQMIQVLQRQLGSRLEKRNVSGKAEKSSPAAQWKSAGTSVQELQVKLANRIKAIDLDDKRRTQKATRIFLETILSNEFGETYLSDPKFNELLEDIQAVMEEDKGMNEQLHILIDHLSK